MNNSNGIDYVMTRNPFDMAEGGNVRDNSTRVSYLLTARKMNQPPLPMPTNKAAITSEVGILVGGIPFRKPGTLLAFDRAFYSGLATIDDQPAATDASSFSTSGSGKSRTNF